MDLGLDDEPSSQELPQNVPEIPQDSLNWSSMDVSCPFSAPVAKGKFSQVFPSKLSLGTSVPVVLKKVVPQDGGGGWGASNHSYRVRIAHQSWEVGRMDMDDSHPRTNFGTDELQEARILRRIEGEDDDDVPEGSDFVLKCFGVCVHHEHGPFLVLERGFGDLEDLLRDPNPQPPVRRGEICTFAIQIATALAALAHYRIAHADVKRKSPNCLLLVLTSCVAANVIVFYRDEQRWVKVHLQVLSQN